MLGLRHTRLQLRVWTARVCRLHVRGPNAPPALADVHGPIGREDGDTRACGLVVEGTRRAFATFYARQTARNGASPACLGMWPHGAAVRSLTSWVWTNGRNGRKPVDKICIRKERRPVRSAVGIVVELPQVHQLMQRARVRDEVAHQLLVEPALVQGGVAKLAIQSDRSGTLPTCTVYVRISETVRGIRAPSMKPMARDAMAASPSSSIVARAGAKLQEPGRRR